VSKAGDKASTAKERSLDKQCSSFMQKICQKYDNVAEVDKLAAVARKVDTVKLVMQENVDQALRNCVQLESIEKAAGACFFRHFCMCAAVFERCALPCCVVVRASSEWRLRGTLTMCYWFTSPRLLDPMSVVCALVVVAAAVVFFVGPIEPIRPPAASPHTEPDDVYFAVNQYRGAAAAGGRVQAQRQRAQEQDVVEEHAGTSISPPVRVRRSVCARSCVVAYNALYQGTRILLPLCGEECARCVRCVWCVLCARGHVACFLSVEKRGQYVYAVLCCAVLAVWRGDCGAAYTGIALRL
jgi:hypothetical protein